MGVAAGDRVLVRLPNSIDYATAFLGTLKRGAIAVPTSTLLTPEEVRYLLRGLAGRRAGDRRGRARPDGPAAARRRHPARGDHRRRAARASARGGGPTEPAERTRPRIRPTSSTPPARPAIRRACSTVTARSSGARPPPRLLVRLPARPADGERVDRIVHSGKFNWTYVLGSALMDPLFRGKTVIAHEGRNEASTWPQLIAKHAATIFIGVPTIYRQILQKTTFTRPTCRRCATA
jgi:hypothetical protein